MQGLHCVDCQKAHLAIRPTSTEFGGILLMLYQVHLLMYTQSPSIKRLVAEPCSLLLTHPLISMFRPAGMVLQRLSNTVTICLNLATY